MRGVLLLLLGLLLASLAGALGQVLRLEWFRPDVLLALVVFGSLSAGGVAGALLAFGLGLVADSLGTDGAGVYGLAYLAVWLLFYSGRRWLWPEMVWVRAVLVLGAGLVTSLCTVLYLLLTGAPAAQIRFQLLVLPLLLLASSLLALPVWWLAEKLWPAPRRVEEG